MKLIIIGGGAGGASVAARVRRLDESAEIILIDKSREISQATCGIPYHLGEVIKDRQRMVVVEPEAFAEILNVDVRIRSRVVEITPKQKSITVCDERSGRLYDETYDKLVLSPGAAPFYPDVPGIDHEHVFSLYNLEQMDQVNHFLQTHPCRRVAVVGGGYIGLEVADNLQALGLQVTLIESSAQLMGALDPEMAAQVRHHLATREIDLYLQNRLSEITPNGVTLASGKQVKADMVIIAAGVRPHTELAAKAGLRVGPLGGLRVDARLSTSAKDIYALGDAIEFCGRKPEHNKVIQLAGPAHKQASVVAANITGKRETYKADYTTSIAKVFDLTAATTGYTEKQLKAMGIDYQKSYAEMPSHASFYPGAFPLTVKLLFTPKRGRVLGAQIVGVSGVDKRIDVIASVIHFKKSVHDLAQLDLAYAPPYSSAKDPVNIAGRVARNMLMEKYPVVFWDEVERLRSEGALFIDVRTEVEFEVDCIVEAINIPLEKLREQLDGLPKERTIVLYCQQGKKSYFACRILLQRGFTKVYGLSGGFRLYQLAASAPQRLEHKQQGRIENGGLNGEDQSSAWFGSSIEDVSLDIDATGLNCPGPLLKLKKGVHSLSEGALLRVTATDPGFNKDVYNWCRKTGHILHRCDVDKAVTTVVVRKCATDFAHKKAG